MTIDEEDITVGRFLYFIKDKNSNNFVGVINNIDKSINHIDGYWVDINYPLSPGKKGSIRMHNLIGMIEDGSIIIK